MELTRSLYVTKSLLEIRQYVVFNVKVSCLVTYTIIFLVTNNGTNEVTICLNRKDQTE